VIWEIKLFETPRGEKPVECFIKRESESAQSKILHDLGLLEQFGPTLGMPHSKLLETGLYELRIRGKNEIRIFYCFHKSRIYLLQGFSKQSQKTPQKELKVARIRKLTVDLL